MKLKRALNVLFDSLLPSRDSFPSISPFHYASGLEAPALQVDGLLEGNQLRPTRQSKVSLGCALLPFEALPTSRTCSCFKKVQLCWCQSKIDRIGMLQQIVSQYAVPARPTPPFGPSSLALSNICTYTHIYIMYHTFFLYCEIIILYHYPERTGFLTF